MKKEEKKNMENLAYKMKKYTFEDLLEIDDDNRYEIIDGELYMMAAPFTIHQMIVGDIYVQLAMYLNGKKCTPFVSPIAVCFGEKYNPKKIDNCVLPDVLVVCDKEKIQEKCIMGAPDLIVEVLSDSTRKRDTLKKYNLYQRYGVKEYLIIDIEGEVIYQYILNEDKVYTLPKTYEITDDIKINILKDCNISLKKLLEEKN